MREARGKESRPPAGVEGWVAHLPESCALLPCTSAGWVRAMGGRPRVVSTGPVPPKTITGTRSHQALKIAMLACWRPTMLWTIEIIGLPLALAGTLPSATGTPFGHE